ncbi:MAG: hypothetical protein U0610_30745 [bacterium]
MDRSVLIRASILLLPAPWPSGVPIDGFPGSTKISRGLLRRFATPEVAIG